VQQFNDSPQTSPEPAEQNADFIEIAIPLSELGGLQGGDTIRVGAVVGLAGVNTNLDQQTRELDRAFLGSSLAGSGLGPVRLEGVAVMLATDPDPDDDGLTIDEEAQWGTDPSKPDTDGDGLLDGWEVRHRLNPRSAAGEDGAQADPDGDGLDNAAEQAAGTDPRDTTSALRMRLTREADGSLRISWEAVPGRTYQLQVATNPAAGFVELPLAGFPRTAVSAVETVSATPAPSDRSALFFRIRLVE
jgi:hypothetical protein